MCQHANPSKQPVRVASCPSCGAGLRGTVSLDLTPRGRMVIIPGDPPPSVAVTWRVAHAEPLCFEWKTERIDAEELMEALNEGEDESPA